MAVVAALADAKGIDPVELETPLYEAIDPEALDALFEPRSGVGSDTTGVVSFTVDGYEVTVTSDAEVTVTAPEAASAAEGSSFEGTRSEPPATADAHWMDCCATCASSLPGTGWSPVTTVRTDDGPEFYAFCDEACQRGWVRAEPTDGATPPLGDSSDTMAVEDSF